MSATAPVTSRKGDVVEAEGKDLRATGSQKYKQPANYASVGDRGLAGVI